jgi:mevalonate kinase
VLVEAVGAAGSAWGITVDAGIPPAAGLGSSAALAVAVARALAAELRRSLPVDEVERIANLCEQRFHANPSGVDAAVAARGGIGVFRRTQGMTPLAAPPLTVAVGLSGQPRSTAAMVAAVANRLGADPGCHRHLAALDESNFI